MEVHLKSSSTSIAGKSESRHVTFRSNPHCLCWSYCPELQVDLVTQQTIISLDCDNNWQKKCLGFFCCFLCNLIFAGREGCSFLVRLFQFVPGDILDGKAYTAELCFEVGHLAGKLSNALKVRVQLIIQLLYLN